MKRKILITTCFLALTFIIVACGQEKTVPDRLDWEVQDFEATDQDGQTLSLADLEGKVWIADFVFTNCTTVCPPMTSNMVKLQERLKEADVPVEIVSFSVDPESDTSEKRKEYITARGGDLSNWSFLGDYPFEYVQNISAGSFKTSAEKPVEGDNQFLHGTSFYLVDQDGLVVKKYSGFKDVPYDEIVEHVEILLGK